MQVGGRRQFLDMDASTRRSLELISPVGGKVPAVVGSCASCLSFWIFVGVQVQVRLPGCFRGPSALSLAPISEPFGLLAF